MRNEPVPTEDTGIGRRDFIRATGVASVALGAGLGASRTFAQAASSPTQAPAGDFHDEITLTNGCACCAVSADLTNSLMAMAEREDPPDAIVLEASGIADPYGLVQVALSNPSIRLDGSLVVVDAETIQELAADPLTRRLFHNQISAADLVVLSKVDLLDDVQRAEARDWLAARFPGTRVIAAVKGDVPVELVLGIDTRRDLQADAPEPTDHAHMFESVSVTIDAPLDGDRLQAVFDALPAALLRAKGVLNLAEEPTRRTTYQRVGRRWSYTPAEPWGDVQPCSSLVFIGPAKLLDGPALEAHLLACRVHRSDAVSA